jgi:hypothetical protein
MSITPYLDDFDVDSETKRVLGAALEMTRVSLGLADDFANGIIAKQIIELARPASAIPICYARAQSRNCAGICTATNTEIPQVAPDPPLLTTGRDLPASAQSGLFLSA